MTDDALAQAANDALRFDRRASGREQWEAAIRDAAARARGAPSAQEQIARMIGGMLPAQGTRRELELLRQGPNIPLHDWDQPPPDPLSPAALGGPVRDVLQLLAGVMPRAPAGSVGMAGGRRLPPKLGYYNPQIARPKTVPDEPVFDLSLQELQELERLLREDPESYQAMMDYVRNFQAWPPGTNKAKNILSRK